MWVAELSKQERYCSGVIAKRMDVSRLAKHEDRLGYESIKDVGRVCGPVMEMSFRGRM